MNVEVGRRNKVPYFRRLFHIQGRGDGLQLGLGLGGVVEQGVIRRPLFPRVADWKNGPSPTWFFKIKIKMAGFVKIILKKRVFFIHHYERHERQ